MQNATKPAEGMALAVERAGGTQAKLAVALGVSQNAVSKWCVRGWAPPIRAKQIADLYGVDRLALIDPKFAALLA